MTSEDGKSQWVVEFIYGRTRQCSEIERLAGVGLDLGAEGFLKFGADLTNFGCNNLSVSKIHLHGDLSCRMSSGMEDQDLLIRWRKGFENFSRKLNID